MIGLKRNILVEQKGYWYHDDYDRSIEVFAVPFNSKTFIIFNQYTT